MRTTHLTRIGAWFFIGAVITLFASSLRAGVALYDPEGVYIDASGVLQYTEVDDEKLEAQRRRALAANPKRTRVTVSLPEAFAAAIAAQERGEPVPDDVRYLRGIVKIEGVEVDPATHDIRLIGFAEPYEKGVGGRIVGSESGRPVVHLDDLAAALRTVGPGHTDVAFGCTIRLPAEGVAKFIDEFHRLSTVIIATKHRQRHEIAQILAKAAGDQEIEFIHQPGDTRMARVCIEADYRMKRLALGLDKPAVAMPSYVSMLTKPDTIVDRFWLQSQHDPVKASADGRRFLISGPGVIVSTRKHFTDPEPAAESPAAERFAKIMTSRYEKLAQFDPVFADLANVSDAALIAAIIGHHKLYEKAGWDIEPVLDRDVYRLREHTVPTRTPALGGWNERNGNAIFTAGGVRFDFSSVVDPDQSDKPD